MSNRSWSGGRLGAIGLCATALGATAVFAADQPQWGQAWSRNPVSEERGLPDTFDPATGKNIKWTAQLGSETHSTPIVAGGRVLIGTNNEEPRDARHAGDRSVLMCFDEGTGAFIWQLVVPKLTNSIYWDWPKSGICSTPTVESNRVYLVSNRGEVLCLDPAGLANGNDGPFRDEARHAVPADEAPVPLSPADADLLWVFDMISECGVRQHDQAHSSTLIHGNHLYVNTSNGVDDSHKEIHAPDAPSLIVLDKRTGRLVAMDNERMGPRVFHSTWSSPALAELNGQPVILFCGGDGLIYAFEPISAVAPGVDANPSQVAKLKKVWQFDCDPTAPKEKVHRYNQNRKESPSNIMSMPVFHAGRVYVTVGGDLWWGKNEAWLKCIDLAGTGDRTGQAEVWSLPLDRHSISTPAVVDGLVFAVDCRRNLYCVEGATGRTLWTHEAKGDFWASPLVADGKVFVGTRRGDFWILKASRHKQLLAEVDLGSPISATATAANGVLYVATMNRIYAVQSDTQTSSGRRPAGDLPGFP